MLPDDVEWLPRAGRVGKNKAKMAEWWGRC